MTYDVSLYARERTTCIRFSHRLRGFSKRSPSAHATLSLCSVSTHHTSCVVSQTPRNDVVRCLSADANEHRRAITALALCACVCVQNKNIIVVLHMTYLQTHTHTRVTLLGKLCFTALQVSFMCSLLTGLLRSRSRTNCNNSVMILFLSFSFFLCSDIPSRCLFFRLVYAYDYYRGVPGHREGSKGATYHPSHQLPYPICAVYRH